MRYEKIQLVPDREEVTLEYFGIEDQSCVRDAMLVIPGGGYGVVCSGREGYPIAQAYMMNEMNTFVLHYSIGKQIQDPMDPLYQASLAVMHIRRNAKTYNIDPERIFAVGFSAGGHLAGSLAALWNKEELLAKLGTKDENRIKGVVLCYAVTLGHSTAGCATTFKNLLMSQTPAEEKLNEYSLEQHVGAHTCPAFIMHTWDDAVVPLENALKIAEAYRNANVPFEMHVYPHGPHGIALANKLTWQGDPNQEDAAIARWVSDSVYWMKKHVR